MVKANKSIPYHMTGSTTNDFDRNKAENFNVDGKLILETGEEVILENEKILEREENMDVLNEEDIVLNRYKEMRASYGR